MEMLNQTRLDGVDQRLNAVKTKLSDIAIVLDVVARKQTQIQRDLQEQSEFRKYVTTLVRRLEKNTEEPGSARVTQETATSNDVNETQTDDADRRKSGHPDMTTLTNTLDMFISGTKRVELPMFDGNDPRGWISRGELYVKINQTPEAVKIPMAQLNMEATDLEVKKGDQVLLEKGNLGARMETRTTPTVEMTVACYTPTAGMRGLEIGVSCHQGVRRKHRPKRPPRKPPESSDRGGGPTAHPILMAAARAVTQVTRTTDTRYFKVEG